MVRILRISVFLIFVSVISFFGCSDNETREQKEISPKQLKHPLEEINKTMNEREKERIASYVLRHKWEMIHTGTGLQYMIYREGSGKQAQAGQRALVNFSVELLNGKKCYSSDEKGAIEFRIGRDHMESGMHEGILLMKVGDKARFIMPAHLAHGFTGDDKKIPKQSAVVYNIELLSVR